MSTEARIFNLVAGFLFAVGGLYAWWTDKVGRLEWAGTLALLLSGTLCALCGMYFAFVARRIVPRPEDRAEADIPEGAGEIGFFSPGSYWPFGIGVATAVAGIGIALDEWWMLVVGVVGALLASGGLLFEYYVGARRPAE